MLHVNKMSKYQALRWLWRYDSEAKWFWFRCFLKGKDLKQAVLDNLSDFGVSSNSGSGHKFRGY